VTATPPATQFKEIDTLLALGTALEIGQVRPLASKA